MRNSLEMKMVKEMIEEERDDGYIDDEESERIMEKVKI